MGINKKIKAFSIMIGIVIVLSVIGSFNFNYDSYVYKRNFDKKYEDTLNSANSGKWLPIFNKTVGNEPRSVFIEDANNDGYNDIITANSGSNTVSILLWNITSGDWDSQITKSVGVGAGGVAIEDTNNDGYNDIVTSNFGDSTISILLWNAISSDWDTFISRSVGGTPTDIFIGDANNDGYNDIATANEGDNNISLLLWNNISGDWDSQFTRSTGSGPQRLFIGDVNNDGYKDIAVSNFYDNNVSILLWNNTSDDWDSQITRDVGNSPRGVSIGDANNDGYSDILTSNTHNGMVSILLWNNTSGDWDSQIKKTVETGPSEVFIGDANNDGYNDIATPNSGPDTVSILLWNITSIDWDPQITKTVGNNPLGIFIGDADTDGDNDIVTANVGDNNVSILQWDTTEEIIINSPNDNQLCGNKAPSFNLTIVEDNLDTSWYSIDEGLTNYSFVGKTGIINQGAWSASPNGTVIIRFYINDTTGVVAFDEVTVRKDTAVPLITIISPTAQTFGIIAPNYNVSIVGNNLDTFWYSIDGGLTNFSFVETSDPINQGAWDIRPTGNVLIMFYANNSADNIGFNEVTVIKDIPVPVITIISPIAQTFGSIAPNYSVSIVGNNLNTFWYSIDGGLTNYSFVEQSGAINQGAWDIQPNGNVTIVFYANNSLGIIGFNEVTVIKYISAPVITINSPTAQTFGVIAPYYSVIIVGNNLDTFWYSIDGGLTNYSFVATSGTIDQGAWDIRPSGNVTIEFYANNSLGNIGFNKVKVIKDIPVPIITIISPTAQTFGSIAPSYSVSIVGNNLDTFWYSIDGELTNYSFVATSGTIDQGAWDIQPNGNVIVVFYANNSLGIIGFNEVTIIKYVEQAEQAEQPIPGYNVFVMIGIMSIISVILYKLRRKYNQN